MQDPCFGRKGILDHTKNMEHIWDRHIRPNADGSQYVFGITKKLMWGPFQRRNKENFVKRRNQRTFESGTVGIRQANNNIAYVDAEYWHKRLGKFYAKGRIVGTDVTRNRNYTNINTVIVGPDCKTVITSFPGLPRYVRQNDPRIKGRVKWWDKSEFKFLF